MLTGVIDVALGRANSFWGSVSQVVPPRQRALACFLIACGFLVVYRFKPDLSILLTAGVLLVLAFLSLLALQGRSRIAPGKASSFLIASKYLRGRDNDIRRLVRIIESEPLLFLTGESGSGKSSTLSQGIIPALANDAAFVAIYIDNWGTDWVRGPYLAVETALRRTLAEDLQKSGWSPEWDRPIASILETMKTTLGRTPLLIFDQFDDYQTQHRSRFIRGSVVRSARALRKANPFWDMIGSLLVQGTIHCVFTTRDDASSLLETVRFIRPRTYILPLADAFIADELLTEIADSGAVEQPENGWHQLTRRIVRDLEAEHSEKVLPVQMVRAFEGLVNLPSLTVREYERRGGLSGIDAYYLEIRLKEIGQRVGWEVSLLLQILSSLIAGNKTSSKTEEELLNIVPESIRGEKTLQIVLGDLEEHKIVRHIILPSSHQLAWRLDHDYILHSVHALSLRVNRWSELLRDAQARWEEATGIWEKYRTLLQPDRQVRLFWEYIQGHLRYGSAVSFARWSLIRLVFNVWIAALIAILVLGEIRADYDAREEARRLVRLSAGLSYGLQDLNQWTPRDKALWKISVANLRLRRAILREELADAEVPQGSALPMLSSQLPLSISLLSGPDLQLRQKIIEPVFRENCSAKQLSDFWIQTCSSLLTNLPSLPSWGADFFNRQIDLRANDADQTVEALASDLASIRSVPQSVLAKTGHVLVQRLTLAQKNPYPQSTDQSVNTTSPGEYPANTLSALLVLNDHVDQTDRDATTAYLLHKMEEGHQTSSTRLTFADGMKGFAGLAPLQRAATLAVTEIIDNRKSDPLYDIEFTYTANQLCQVSAEFQKKVVDYIIQNKKIAVISMTNAACFHELPIQEQESIGQLMADSINDPQMLTSQLLSLDLSSPSVYATASDRLAQAIDKTARQKNIEYQTEALIQTVSSLGHRASNSAVEVACKYLSTAITKRLKEQPSTAQPNSLNTRWSDISRSVGLLVSFDPIPRDISEAVSTAVINEALNAPNSELPVVAPIVSSLILVAKSDDVERYQNSLTNRISNAQVSELADIARAFDSKLNQRLPQVADIAASSLLQRFQNLASKPFATKYDDKSDLKLVTDALLILPHRPDEVSNKVLDIFLKNYQQAEAEQKNSFSVVIMQLGRSSDRRVQSVASAYYDEAIKKQNASDPNLQLAAPLLDADSKRTLLRRAVTLMKNLPFPACGMITQLATQDDIGTLLDAFKWPTCSGAGSYGGNSIQTSISLLLPPSQATAVPTQPPLPGTFVSVIPPQIAPLDMDFLLAVAAWAEQHHYDLASPASPPPAALPLP